jgi:hypothetical protein
VLPTVSRNLSAEVGRLIPSVGGGRIGEDADLVFMWVVSEDRSFRKVAIGWTE